MTRAKIPPPNYTQAPNVLLDELLPEIGTLGELKVILVVVRETIGWHEDEGKLTFSELERRTGLSRTAVSDGVQRAIERGVIERRMDGAGGAREAFYALNLSGRDSLPTSVGNSYQGRSSVATDLGSESTPTPIEERNEKENTPDPLKGDTDKWAEALEHLKSQLPDTTFHVWVKPLTLVGRRGDTLIVRAPEHLASWVRERFADEPAGRDMLGSAVALAFGPNVGVEIEETEGEREGREKRELADSRKVLRLDRDRGRRGRRAS